MKEIIIIGAGGHAIEIAWLASRCKRKVKGFLDDTLEKQGKCFSNIPVLGKIEERKKYLECEFIIAIGNPRARNKIVDYFFSDEHYSFATLIDPTCILGENIKVGEGSMICAGTILTINVDIGNHCIVNINSTLSHGVKLDDYVTIAPNVSISGDVCLKQLVEIGANSSIREKVTIYDGAMVGMGTVVIKDIEENHTVVGNPSRIIKILN
ncbi:acetyltransferase [Acinetobacter sp. LoGeW2-3]|uniref:acetyltransferase n=1 Tax=Acinetobacter sp. LoGeW2-3 TaxID=1808001 RepID=UPI000C058C2E|nr:acetyltransferase [Acinetobacter sp. LoGeW2-3]ATO19569.1 acetyltransferase [Acinetobacter sp. LoGeW2-3]